MELTGPALRSFEVKSQIVTLHALDNQFSIRERSNSRVTLLHTAKIQFSVANPVGKFM